MSSPVLASWTCDEIAAVLDQLGEVLEGVRQLLVAVL